MLAPDGKTLVAPGNPAIAPVWATAPPTVRVIELTPRGVRPLVAFDGPWKTGYPYGVSPDSSLLVVGNLGDKALWLCPLTAARRKDLGLGKGESARSVPLPEPPTAVGFSGDMRLLAVAGFWTLGVWDWQRRKELVPLSGHRGPVQALSFAPDGSMLVTGGREGTMALWEWAGRRARLRHYLRLASGPVELVAFAPDGKSLVSNTSGDGKGVRFWDISGPRPVERGRFQPHSLATRWVAFGPQEDVLLTVGENRDAERNRRDAQVVCLWDCHSVPPELRHIIALNDPSNYDDRRADPFNMRTAVLSPSGKDLAIVQAGTVRLWDLRGRSPKDRGLLNERIPGKSFNALAFSPDGESLFAVGHGDRHLQLRSWRISSRACKEQAAIRGRIRSEGKQLAFAPDGNRLAWVEGDGRCVVWDVVRRKVVVAWLLPGEPSGVTFAPDSRHLAMASPNGTAYILRLPAVATEKDR